MSYLYLFYEDYNLKEKINPYEVISNAKENIRQAALSKLTTVAAGSKEIEKEFEKIYQIKPEDFSDNGDLDPSTFLNSNRLSAVNLDMTSFDEAINLMVEGIENTNSGIDALAEGNKAIHAIDAVLKKGASTGGLADDAIVEARLWKKRLQNLKGALANGTSEDDIAKQIKNVAGHIGGALLEIAVPYAFLLASEKGLDAIDARMLGIGAHTGPRISTTLRQDPKYVSDVMAVREMLKANHGVQSKADSIVNIDSSKVSGTATWVGFQSKNYTDIAKIKIANYSLADIGIQRFYSYDFLINITGTLAGDQYNKNRVPKSLRHGRTDHLVFQYVADNVWNSVKNSTKLLGAADAIAGEMNTVNGVNYYVIRSRSIDAGGPVRVIATSTILNNIKRAFKNEEINSFMGINIGDNENEKAAGGSRAEFWKINEENFQPWKGPYTPYIRSGNASGAIWNKILSTRIKISLNFSSFFQ